MNTTDGTFLVMFACICVAFERIGLAVTMGDFGAWLLLR